jgi:hypothetical protein
MRAVFTVDLPLNHENKYPDNASLVNSIDMGGHTFTAGTMERMSTALLTTALVSSLNLCETYLEIYRNRVIVW